MKRITVLMLVFVLLSCLLPSASATPEDDSVVITYQPQSYCYPKVEGSTILYEVRVEAASEPTFKWYFIDKSKNSSPVDEVSEELFIAIVDPVIMEGNEYRSLIKLTEISTTIDEGSLYCEINGSIHTDAAYINLIEGMIDPPFIHVPNEVTLFKGQSTLIFCLATAVAKDDSLNFKWYKSEGKQFLDCPLEDLNNYTDTLKIDTSELEIGQHYYHCNIKHDSIEGDNDRYGSRTSFVTVTVLSPDSIIDIKEYSLEEIPSMRINANYDNRNYEVELIGSDEIKNVLGDYIVSAGDMSIFEGKEDILELFKPAIIIQPQDMIVDAGHILDIKFYCTAENALEYEWICERPDGTTEPLQSGGEEITLSLDGTNTYEGCQFYCKVIGVAETIESEKARIILTTKEDAPPTESDTQSKEEAPKQEATKEEAEPSMLPILLLIVSIALSIVSMIGAALILKKLRK